MQRFLAPRSNVSNAIQAELKCITAAVVADQQKRKKSDVCAKKNQTILGPGMRSAVLVDLYVEKDMKGASSNIVTPHKYYLQLGPSIC